MTTLEHKEIRGVTWKIALFVIGSTVSVMYTLLTGIGNIRKDIYDADKRSEMNEVSIKAQGVQIDKQQVQIDKLQIDINQLKEQYYKLTYKR